jgi:putative NADPH-quinone reductase
MPVRKILIIDAHPDPDLGHFIHALAAEYAIGAARHETRTIKLGELDFPMVRSTENWLQGKPPAAIATAQNDILWAEHLAIFFPLWLGDMPALLKAFLEQVMRPGFALAYEDRGFPGKLLSGRTARIVVTMGMPGLLYRHFYRAHSLKCLERNILKMVGIRPVGRTIIGSVEAGEKHRRKWLAEMKLLGAAGR